jgi:hypothetical protein
VCLDRKRKTRNSERKGAEQVGSRGRTRGWRPERGQRSERNIGKVWQAYEMNGKEFEVSRRTQRAQRKKKQRTLLLRCDKRWSWRWSCRGEDERVSLATVKWNGEESGGKSEREKAPIQERARKKESKERIAERRYWIFVVERNTQRV